jgi:hypothetical protein
MAVIVEELRVDNPEEGDSEGKEGSTFLSVLDPELHGRLHITVGMELHPCLFWSSRAGGVVREGREVPGQCMSRVRVCGGKNQQCQQLKKSRS